MSDEKRTDPPCRSCDNPEPPSNPVDGMRFNCGDCGRVLVWNEEEWRWERWNEPSVTFAPHVERGIAGAKAWAASAPVDDTLAAIYVEAFSRDRRCPECGSREINATETVCLACSNRAWSDR